MTQTEWEAAIATATKREDWDRLARAVRADHVAMVNAIPGIARNKRGALTKRSRAILAREGHEHEDYPNWWFHVGPAFDRGFPYLEFLRRIGEPDIDMVEEGFLDD